MGHRGVPVFPVLALLLSSFHPVQAQPSTRMDLTVFAAGALFLSELASEMVVCNGSCVRLRGPKMHNGIGIGAHAGLRFGAWSMEGTAGMIPSSWSGAGTDGSKRCIDTNVFLLGGNVLYTIPAKNQLGEVFLAAGWGSKIHSPGQGDSQSNLMGSLGLGLKVWMTPSMALRLDARDYISPYQDGNLQNDLLLSVGLSVSPR